MANLYYDTVFTAAMALVILIVAAKLGGIISYRLGQLLSWESYWSGS
jgi:hypothetical protein